MNILDHVGFVPVRCALYIRYGRWTFHQTDGWLSARNEVCRCSGSNRDYSVPLRLTSKYVSHYVTMVTCGFDSKQTR